MQPVLNNEEFAVHVSESSGKVLVEFFATWCPHCQRMQPILDDVAEQVEGECKVYQVDVDKSPELASEFAPEGFPTYVLFENGTPVTSLFGEQPEQTLLNLVRQ